MGVGDHDIYDVAEKAQVSIATVSRVLNAPASVSEATRARVLAAIDELGFVPKADAAARARKATHRIAVVAPFFTYPSFTPRLRGVAEALARRAYELTIHVVDSSEHRDAYLASLAVTRRVDGLIVMALPFDEKMARRLLAGNIETVLVEFEHAPFSCVEVDNQEGGRLAARHFLATGHRRCAFVGVGRLGDGAWAMDDFLTPCASLLGWANCWVATVCCYSWVLEEGVISLDSRSNLSAPLTLPLLSKGQTSSPKIFPKIASC